MKKPFLILMFWLIALPAFADYSLVTAPLDAFWTTNAPTVTFTAAGVNNSSPLLNGVNVLFNGTNVWQSIASAGANAAWTMTGSIGYDGTNLNGFVQYQSGDPANPSSFGSFTITNAVIATNWLQLTVSGGAGVTLTSATIANAPLNKAVVFSPALPAAVPAPPLMLQRNGTTLSPAMPGDNITTTGTNTAIYFIGNGAGLTGVTGGSGVNPLNGSATNLTVYGTLTSTNMMNAMTNVAAALTNGLGGGSAGWSTNVAAVNVFYTNTTASEAYFTNVILTFTPSVSGNYTFQGWMNCPPTKYNYNFIFLTFVAAVDELGATNYFTSQGSYYANGFVSYSTVAEVLAYSQITAQQNNHVYFVVGVPFYAVAGQPITVTQYLSTQEAGYFFYDYWFKLSAL